MPREARAAWLARIIADVGRDRLTLLASDVSHRILAQPNDRHMPSATWRWAVVASHATSPLATLRDAFEHELNTALEQRNRLQNERAKMAGEVGDLRQQLASLQETQANFVANLAERARGNIDMMEKTVAMTGLDVNKLLAVVKQ